MHVYIFLKIYMYECMSHVCAPSPQCRKSHNASAHLFNQYVNVSVETCSYMLHAVSLRFLFKRAHGFCRGLSPSTSKKSRAKVDSNGSIACSLLGRLLELHVRWYYCLATKQLWLMLEFFVVSKSSSPSPDPPQKQVQAYTLQYHLKHHLIPPFTSSLEHTLPFQVPLPLSSSGWGGSQSWSERSSKVMRCHAVSWRQWKGTRRKDTHIQDEQINATSTSSQSPEPRIIKKMNFMMQKPERTLVFYVYKHRFSNAQLFIQEAVRDHCSPSIWRAVPPSVWQSSLFSLLWS